MTMEPSFLSTDVLVVGGGLAGCWAAIRARQLGAKVILAEKSRVARSGASTFTNNMLAPCKDAEKEVWLRELVELGEYLNDQDWVVKALEEQGKRIADMADWGVPFQRTQSGELRETVGRGHISTRIVLCNGHDLMDTMRRKATDLGVEILDRVAITDLLTSDGLLPTSERVVGAFGIQTRTGQPVVIEAPAVVITTGQIGSKLRAHFVNNLVGDGVAMACRAGAELVNMEFCTSGNISYYMRRYHSGGQSLLQGMGAKFINKNGERFMERYDPSLRERSKLSYLVQAFAKENLEGRGPIYWDMSSFSQEDVDLVRRLLPTTMRPFDEAGIDVRRQPIECTPVVGITSAMGEGGIRINGTCAASIPGLFAAGAAAWNPIHGTYTVGGINLAFCNVGGYTAGENAALFARDASRAKVSKEQVSRLSDFIVSVLDRETGVTPDEVIRHIQRLVIPAQNNIFKNQQRIEAVLRGLNEIKEEVAEIKAPDPHELVKSVEARNLALLSRVVYLAALERTESRSWHYREEYPYRDDIEWLKWIVVRSSSPDGEFTLDKVSVPIETYPVKPQNRQRIPHPVQITLN